MSFLSKTPPAFPRQNRASHVTLAPYYGGVHFHGDFPAPPLHRGHGPISLLAARERHDHGAPCRLSPADVEPRRKSAPSRLTGRATTDPRATAPQDHRWPGQRPAGRTRIPRGQPDCASAGLRPERPGLHAVNRQLNTHLTASPARTDPARRIRSATCRQRSTSSTGRTGSRLPNLFPNLAEEDRDDPPDRCSGLRRRPLSTARTARPIFPPIGPCHRHAFSIDFPPILARRDGPLGRIPRVAPGPDPGNL